VSGDDVVHNEMSGTAGNFVQAHTVGSVTFAAARPAPSAVPRLVPPPPVGFVDRTVVLDRLTVSPEQDHRPARGERAVEVSRVPVKTVNERGDGS
jgi:hypothetical protein